MYVCACAGTRKHTRVHANTHVPSPVMKKTQHTVIHFTAYTNKCDFRNLDYNFKIMHSIVLDYKIRNKQTTIKHNFIK